MGQAYQGVPELLPNGDEHRRQIARAVNRLNQAKFNCSLSVTLTASSATTTIKDSRISYGSVFTFTPQTAHAAAELASGNLYIPQSTVIPSTGSTAGQAIIQHTNNSQSDRTFIVGIFG